MQLVNLQVEHFKRVNAVEITFGEQAILNISGDNASGKTSILDALEAALAGERSICSEPIHTGSDTAKITITTDTHSIERHFKRADGAKSYTTKLVVKTIGGATFSGGQTILDSLGAQTVTFDPIEWVKMGETSDGRKKQLNDLIRILDLGGFDPFTHDAKRKEVYDKRTEANRSLLDAKSRLSAVPVPAKDCPSEYVDVASLSRELEKDQRATIEFDIKVNAKNYCIRETEQMIVTFTENVERLQRELQQAKSALDGWKDSLKSTSEEVKGMVAPESNAESLRSQIANAETVNNAVRNKVMHGKLSQTHSEHEATVAGISKQLEELDTLKRKSIESAVMPVDGLSFDSEKGELIFTGVPFAQASSAQQIRVAVALAMAKNPKIRVILIRDGSLLDRKSYALLEELAKKYNFLVVMESVMPHSKSAIEIVDGSVKE